MRSQKVRLKPDTTADPPTDSRRVQKDPAYMSKKDPAYMSNGK